MMKKYQVDGFAFIGRTFDEYYQMFDLTDDELQSNSFLDCPGGACSFVAEAFEQGVDAKAIDCEYGQLAGDVELICQSEVEKIRVGMQGAEDLFDWSFYNDVDQLLRFRKKALELFLASYQLQSDRYIQGRLPELDIPDDSFDIVLSGHFLFLYADRLDVDFHLESILELLRVARKEVRIYPLIGLDGMPYVHMEMLLEKIKEQGYVPELKDISFQFLKGSSQMLLIRTSV